MKIKHVHAREQAVIIGSQSIALDDQGYAEVSEETYNSVAGMKNWIRLLPDGTEELKEAVVEDTPAAAQSDPVLEDAIADEASLLKSEVERLQAENEDLRATVEALQEEVKVLQERLTYGGPGKSMDELANDLKKDSKKTTPVRTRERGK